MSKLMLIDASHPEETRVVAADNDRVQDYDVVTSTKNQIKGNIYLAKVTRVEPSLQAAFVDYGMDRQGFLPFSEIHPDYYQIPVADKEKLKAEAASSNKQKRDGHDSASDDHDDDGDDSGKKRRSSSRRNKSTRNRSSDDAGNDGADDTDGDAHSDDQDNDSTHNGGDDSNDDGGQSNGNDAPHVETISGEEEDMESSPKHYQFLKRYKIQEVVKKGQVLLIQVIKEERGSKGAAVSTYISTAGRYCVLMPNTSNAGGISRKINSGEARRKLKSISDSLNVADGMSVIIRTAGIDRTRPEIKRDLDYLKRLWDTIREQTLSSSAPALIYEENDLIKRAIRDLYKNDIDQVLVEGEEAYKSAKSFMKMLMPSHAARVKHYHGDIPLFYAYDIEEQLLAMHNPDVSLRSGGYLVINPTEALVSIDVNSGRATRERNIEETALKTNIEAAHEIARQLRLRDLSGLLVIDFIDMYEYRNRRKVERALKDALRNDRARIQVGRISAFGLMEMSRQRLRPSVTESNTHTCPHCTGSGIVRSTESFALQLLRAIEKEAHDDYFNQIEVTTRAEVAMYALNHKRIQLNAIEQKYKMTLEISADITMTNQGFLLIKTNTSNNDTIAINESGNVVSGTKQAKQAHRTAEKQLSADHQEHHTVPDRSQDDQDSQDSQYNQDSRSDTRNDDDRDDQDNKDDRDDNQERGGRRGRRGRRGGRRGRRGGRDRQNSQYPENQESGEFQNMPDDMDGVEPFDFDTLMDNAEPNAPAADNRSRNADSQSDSSKDDDKSSDSPRPRRRSRAKPKDAESGNDGESAPSPDGEADKPARKRPARRKPAARTSSDDKSSPDADAASADAVINTPKANTPSTDGAQGDADDDKGRRRWGAARRKELEQEPEKSSDAPRASAPSADAASKEKETGDASPAPAKVAERKPRAPAKSAKVDKAPEKDAASDQGNASPSDKSTKDTGSDTPSITPAKSSAAPRSRAASSRATAKTSEASASNEDAADDKKSASSAGGRSSTSKRSGWWKKITE